MSEHSVTVQGGLHPVTGFLGGGNGRLQGSVLGSDDGPLARQVHVFEEIGVRPGNLDLTRLLHRGTVRSSATDGSWTVEYLPMNARYTAQAFDDTGQYDPVTKAGLIPEPMKD